MVVPERGLLSLRQWLLLFLLLVVLRRRTGVCYPAEPEGVDQGFAALAFEVVGGDCHDLLVSSSRQCSSSMPRVPDTRLEMAAANTNSKQLPNDSIGSETIIPLPLKRPSTGIQLPSCKCLPRRTCQCNEQLSLQHSP